MLKGSKEHERASIIKQATRRIHNEKYLEKTRTYLICFFFVCLIRDLNPIFHPNNECKYSLWSNVVILLAVRIFNEKL